MFSWFLHILALAFGCPLPFPLFFPFFLLVFVPYPFNPFQPDAQFRAKSNSSNDGVSVLITQRPRSPSPLNTRFAEWFSMIFQATSAVLVILMVGTSDGSLADSRLSRPPVEHRTCSFLCRKSCPSPFAKPGVWPWKQLVSNLESTALCILNFCGPGPQYARHCRRTRCWCKMQTVRSFINYWDILEFFCQIRSHFFLNVDVCACKCSQHYSGSFYTLCILWLCKKICQFIGPSVLKRGVF